MIAADPGASAAATLGRVRPLQNDLARHNGVMCRSSTSRSKDEVLEVGTFMRWGGPVEAFPDAGRFDEPRGGGGRVARG